MCIIFVELYLSRTAQETGFLVCGCDMIGALLITISLVGTDVNVTLISSDYLNSRFMGSPLMISFRPLIGINFTLS